jgi:hypothetical protein
MVTDCASDAGMRISERGCNFAPVAYHKGPIPELQEEVKMCRNIRTLFNFEPPASADEIEASALQFARKLSGFTRPSKANEAAFDRAVKDVTQAARKLISALETNAPARNREVEAIKARERSKARFA